MNCPIIKWMPWQESAVLRFSSRCRNQHGGILVHSMGSGKTKTTLGIMLNMPFDKKIIVVPQGLESNWIKEIDSLFRGIDNTDYLENVFGKRNDKGYTKVSFVSYQSLNRMVTNESNTQILQDMFYERQIYCDEAHRLLYCFRNQSIVVTNSNGVQDLLMNTIFNASKKVILITGTPLQKDWSDVGLLANIAAGEQRFPTVDSDFNVMYPAPVNWWQKVLSVGGLGSNVGVPILNKLQGAYASIVAFKVWAIPFLLPYATSLYNSLMQSANSDDASANFNSLSNTLSNEVSTDVSSQKSNILIAFTVASAILAGVSYLNTQFNRSLIDTNILAKELSPFISFYNYEIDNDPSVLLRFPKRHYLEVPIVPDQLQLVLLMGMAHGKGGFSDREKICLGLSLENDSLGSKPLSIRDIVLFQEKARVFTNISMFNYKWKTVRRPENAKSPWGQYEAIHLKSGSMTEEENHKQAQLNYGVFECEKYAKALEIITDEYEKSNKLPVVYSSYYEFGFQTFSAFLTSRLIDHIVIHKDDLNIEEKRLVSQKTGTEIHNIHGIRPKCVLIHPELTEGLDFVVNPAILVLEPPIGYGNQQQIYARVLRQQPRPYSTLEEKLKDSRKIYQFKSTLNMEYGNKGRGEYTNILQAYRQFIPNTSNTFLYINSIMEENKKSKSVKDAYTTLVEDFTIKITNVTPDEDVLQTNAIQEATFYNFQKLLNKTKDDVASCVGEQTNSQCQIFQCPSEPGNCGETKLTAGKRSPKRLVRRNKLSHVKKSLKRVKKSNRRRKSPNRSGKKHSIHKKRR